MAVQKGLRFFGHVSITQLFGLRLSVQKTILLGLLLLHRSRLLLARPTKVDDVGHLYFLRKASSETTSAPLFGASADTVSGVFVTAFLRGSGFFAPEAGDLAVSSS